MLLLNCDHPRFRIKMSTPSEFFKAVEDKEGRKLCTWRGELYLEMHNGTYTTHAKVKKGLCLYKHSSAKTLRFTQWGTVP